MKSKWTRLIFILLLIIAAGLATAFFWQLRRANEAELQADLSAGRVLNAIFAQAQELRVATLRGDVVVGSKYDGTIFDPEQITKAPFSVSYFVDLGTVKQGSYVWDAKRRTMIVTIPDVSVESPNIDISRQVVRQKGIWISRKAGVELQRTAHRRMLRVANGAALSDANIRAAREAARIAVGRMVRFPLAAAGISDLSIRVIYSWEEGGSSAQWDRSRSIDQVFGNQF